MGNSLRLRPATPGITERQIRKKETLEITEQQITKKEIRRGCKRKRSTYIESLPDDLLFDIFLLLPAQDIHNGARLVCKKWHKIIHNMKFIHEHCRHSNPGLLIHCRCKNADALFMSIRKGRIETSKLSYSFHAMFGRSCNKGPIVECRLIDCILAGTNNYLGRIWNLYVVNPATKRQLTLPGICVDHSISGWSCGIACASSSMEYKVVHTYYLKNNIINEQYCSIVTVGVDNYWRRVQTQHLPLEVSELLSGIPLATEGFIHWTGELATHVLTLNIETEIITETPIPEGYSGERSIFKKYYLSTGRFLTLFIASGYSSDIWQLNPETGEWTMVIKIDLEPQKRKLGNLVHPDNNPILVPAGWLNYPEVLVLSVPLQCRVCVLYNVRTREIDFFKFDPHCRFYTFGAHRNSLL